MVDISLVVAPEVRVRVDTPFYVGFITTAGLLSPMYDLVIGNIPGVANGKVKGTVTQMPDTAVTTDHVQ